MGKWDDDIPLQPVGSVQPTTVHALLRKLRLTGAAEEVKTAAISDWLIDHTPNDTLVNSLRRNGYADLINSRVSA